MGLAETAQLAVNLSLQGNFGTGIAKAEGELAGLNATASKSVASTGVVASGLSKVSLAATGVGGALSHAGGQIKNLITGPLGMLGLGGALFGVAGLFKGSIDKASEFAFAIEKLQGLTNDSADSLAQLIAVTDNYGISADRLGTVVGFAEKAMGNLATTEGGAAKFAAQYGFAITDAAGKVLPFNDLLLKAADFYNSNADQSTKAALAAKLFGRGYVDLVPILKLGSQGIRDAEAAAKDLGITLTDANVQDLAKFRDTTRELDDAMTGLKLQIGVGLVPAFTELAKSATSFISDHRGDIVAFFKGAVEFGRQAVGIIGQVAGALGTAWNAIPAPLRDFLVKGIIADRTIKFLFGFDPIATLGKSLFGSVGSQFFARGSSPANPMFVSGIGGGGGPGILGGLEAGTLAGIVTLAAGIAAPFIMFNLLPSLFPGPPSSTGTSVPSRASTVAQPSANLIGYAYGQVNTQLGPNGQIYPNGRPTPVVPTGTGGLSPDARDEAFVAKMVALYAYPAIDHAAARKALDLKTFRGSASGAISEFPDLIRYLSGAQGGSGGKGNAGFLATIGSQVSRLQALQKGASPEQSAKIASEIVVLQDILRGKRFEPSSALIDILRPTPAKTGLDKFPGKLRDDVATPLGSKIDYAKVQNTRATDAATAAINASRDAIVRAILGKTQVVVQVTAAAVTKAQATVAAHQNPTTMNNMGHVAS